MKCRIAKDLEQLKYNPELFFYFWLKNHEKAMFAYKQLNIQTMRDLVANIRVLYQEASFFEFDKRSNLSNCIENCQTYIKTKQPLQFEKEMDESPCCQKNAAAYSIEKKIAFYTLQDKKTLVLKALEASGYDAELFLSFETKDWQAAHLAFKSLSIIKMKELLDGLLTMQKETGFFSFKRKRQLQSCLYICEGSFVTKYSMLSDEQKQEFTNYKRKKKIAAILAAKKLLKLNKNKIKSVS